MAQFQITTAARVKAQKGISGSGLDALIAILLDAVSEKAEDALARRLFRTTYTEVVPLRARKRYVSLLGFPVTAVTSVKYASRRSFTDVEAMAATEYDVLGPEGQIYLAEIETWLDPGFVEVQYTGGMAVDTAAFIAAYPSLANAADNEIIARLNRAKMPEGNLQAMGSEVGFLKALQPLEDFYNALAPHRRLRL